MTCPGHSYKGHCKHVDAVAALLANAWLDERETVSDKHAEAEEKDAFYARHGI